VSSRVDEQAPQATHANCAISDSCEGFKEGHALGVVPGQPHSFLAALRNSARSATTISTWIEGGAALRAVIRFSIVDSLIEAYVSDEVHTENLL
jgi:hypothetical protein